MSETEEKEPRTKVNGKLKLGIAFLSITIGCLIARPFWIEQQNVQHNEQYAYLDSIKIINPVEYAQKLYDEGHYKDAQDYIAFYQDRIDKGLPVDRPSCPYNAETLKDRKMIKSSMLTNPFEKFERKRFMYYSKDLGVISLNHALMAKMSGEDWERVKRQMREDLERYYKE